MKTDEPKNQKRKGLEDLITVIDNNEDIPKEEKRNIYEVGKDPFFGDEISSNFRMGYEIGKRINNLEEENSIQIINSVLVNSFNTLEKEEFNNLVKDWTERYIESKEKNILEEREAGEVIEKYHETFSGYFSNDIAVKRENDYIEVEMIRGCPYGKFCEQTDNRKCVRGTVFKYLLNESENNGDAWNIPILEKSHSEDRSCKVKLYKNHDELIKNFMSIEELEKEKNAL